MKPVNVSDYEALAQTCMETSAWDYYQGGSDDEITVRANRTAFERISLRPRMLIDVSTVDTSLSVLGAPISLPVLIAPTGYQGLAHPGGELLTAQGAGWSQTLMVVSTYATRTLEDIAEAARGPLWFQLYIHRDLQLVASFVQRAEAAGYRALVLTIDTPRLGRRERDLRNNFTLPGHLRAANLPPEEGTATYIPQPAPLTWETVDWLSSTTSLPIILKGVLTAEDARLALEHGAAGIFVSNHGGRQLDGVLASIEALPEIAEVVAGRCEIYLDGGIRRGTDVLKALALGARAVLIGRPALWGLAVNGAEGVSQVLEMLRTELELAMVLSGCPTLTSIDCSRVKVTEKMGR